jgi:hypothetical protein
MLTPDEVTAILATTDRKKGRTVSPTKYMLLRDGTRVPFKRSDAGMFDSKTGSTRRSRKGRTRRMPDGYARYNYPYGSEDIVAYLNTP